MGTGGPPGGHEAEGAPPTLVPRLWVPSGIFFTQYFLGIIRFMPLVVSHSSILPLIPKSHRFCPSHFDPLMLLPFDRLTVSLKTS